MFGWLRRRTKARPIPDVLWAEVVERYAFLTHRTVAERDRLRQMTAEFLAAKEFHGAKGFVVTDEVALSIAAQAVLPVLHLGLSWYDDFVGIVVHADEVVARRTAMDEAGVVHQWDEVISGEAMEGGPVMISWHDAAGMAPRGLDPYNVVIHEFVHKIDMRDGRADGCPPMPPAARRNWTEVMQREYQAFREMAIIAERFGGEPTWLDPYGAQSIDEFFAVACEAYFIAPQRFAAEHTALATLFDRFFGPRQRG